jgi:hypothetical protein
MASQAKVMGAVSQSVDFIISKAKDDIVSYNVEKNINLTTDQLRSISSLLEASIRDSYNRTMDQIISTLD